MKVDDFPLFFFVSDDGILNILWKENIFIYASVSKKERKKLSIFDTRKKIKSPRKYKSLMTIIMLLVTV